MMSDNLSPRQRPAALSAPIDSERSYVDWAAILAGAVFALAFSFLLISFGTGLGLSLTSPYRGEGVSAAWFAIAAGIWFAWVMVTGFGAGGYFAGRLRRRAGDATAPEVEARDGGHGLMVWATGALVGTVLAAMGVGGVLTAGGATVGKVADGVTEAASSDYFANVMLRNASAVAGGSATAPAPETMAPGTTAPETTGAAATAPETTGAPAAPLTPSPAAPAAPAANIDPAVQAQVAAILARSAASGEMAERDTSYLVQVVAANSDLDEAEARTRVNEVNAEIDAARAEAVAAVEKARVAGVVFGFIAAATLLIGAVAAFFAAVAGGRHRDEGLGLDVLTARR